MGKVRIAIVGVGNCASSLVQGLTYYQNASAREDVPGLMHVELGGYHVRDVEVSAAFDIDAEKVGRDVSDAIRAGQNNTLQFAQVPELGVTVRRGRTLDGISSQLASRIVEADGPACDVAAVLAESRTDVLLNYLPVGSEAATRWYVEQALAARCAVVNCIPVFIASNPEWRRRFEEARLPIVGDDVKSQVGATILHRMLVRLFQERGVRLDRTSQLNVGGNMDFYNMLDRERLESKKISKTAAVTSQLDYALPAGSVHIGPSDYVPWLEDRKWAHIRLEGRGFGDAPISMELKLEVWDSPNSAGVVIDALRCAKLALDAGIGGALAAPSAYFMKSPPQQFPEPLCHDKVEQFIEMCAERSPAAAEEPYGTTSR